MNHQWDINQIPSLEGKRAIITGGNSGIGLETAKTITSKGGEVILAVRHIKKGEQAKDEILKENELANVTVMKLDLSHLESVKEFTDEFANRFESLDILINNAGVMMLPYQKTKEGFEMQFGSNHLGHFVLVGKLLPLLQKTPNARIVTVSSLAHRRGKIYFENLDGTKGYNRSMFYAQSKLANLLFAKELDRRLKEAGIPILSIACHPGISSTNLFTLGKQKTPWFMKVFLKYFSQPANMGSLPTLYAATNKDLVGGEYIGPDGPLQRKGYPTIETPYPNALNKETMKKLWDISEELTGIAYEFR